ncbi:MAG: DUF4065 domain-containing protein [Halothece sp. Uz-M2-17]|nr:DUF4065 domain-containing protein [Halothece sp. Uz-M2-17]
MSRDVNVIVDYIICRLLEVGDTPTVLKVQKLLYYTQAWFLALNENDNEVFFNEQFQAWVHGPVCRKVYERFRDEGKIMFSALDESDLMNKDVTKCLEEQDVLHIDNVLEAYGDLSGTQLEALTHQEDPWLNARKGLKPLERSENSIQEEDMRNYYRKQLQVSV